MTSNSPLSGELIQQTTEAVGNFLRWIAALIVSRNWFSLLILFAILGVFLLNPSNGLAFKLLGIDPQTLPDDYARGFWLVEAGMGLAALAIAVHTMPRAIPVSQADIADRKAIKGLRPFDSSDAPVFAQLQRQRNRRECLESIASRVFRFGILHGESGCGKTSFLQAGILPALTPDNTGQIGVYVRFSDRDPMLTLTQAIAEQLELPLDWLLPEAAEQDSFLSLLVKVTDHSDQPLVLLLDQFEQFFVHYKRKAQRQPFIQSLSAWYRSDLPLPVKIVVSIRSDLMYHLDELHQALGYSLAPHDVFRLEKFTPTEASRVLEVISQTEGLDFNRAFVAELAQAELADREDGLISPVDLQILAWMIERQTTEELRAFNRNAFQKFGGVEGLLQRFLERTLEARVSEKQRQSAVKVLLALTDLDRQVRAGMLTAPELKAKLQGSAKSEEVAEAVAWLARGDVRLITPQEKEGEVAYELAHERLIPALMRQAGKELSAADRANRLLDRRVNEWLGNHCQGRYLFGLPELWLLDRQMPYLVWGAKREQKEKLLRRSRRRVYGGLAALLLGVVLVSGVTGGLTYTPRGQILKMQWQLSALLRDASSGAIVADAAIAFAKNDQWNQAFDIAKQYLQAKETSNNPTAPKDRDLATFIEQSANFLVYVTPTEGKATILARLQALTNTIQSDRYKSYALLAIAEATGEIADPAQAQAVFSQALQAAQAIPSDSYKSEALRAIAEAALSLTDDSRVQDFLKAALRIMHREKTSAPMVIIANYYAQQSNWFQALHALSPAEKREKRIGLSQMLTILAEHKTPQLIPGAIVLPSGPKGIEVSGQPGNYTLTVQIQSPDESCQKYADWWEVITPDGVLIRRQPTKTVHQDEHPFSDTLVALDISADQTVLIRAHFRGQYFYKDDLLVDDRLRAAYAGGRYEKSGYTDQALKGSIAEGFQVVRISENFAKWLEKEEPLPNPDACTEP